MKIYKQSSFNALNTIDGGGTHEGGEEKEAAWAKPESTRVKMACVGGIITCFCDVEKQGSAFKVYKAREQALYDQHIVFTKLKRRGTI